MVAMLISCHVLKVRGARKLQIILLCVGISIVDAMVISMDAEVNFGISSSK